MDIDALAQSVALCKEENDLFNWLKKSGNTSIHLGDKIKIKNVLMFVTGGTENGNLYCQKLNARLPKSKRRFDPDKSKVIIHWKTFLYYKTLEKEK